MHHRDEVGEECAAVQLKELEQVLVGSDCLSVRINDVQKKKKKKKKSMCARLNRCQSTTSFFFFPFHLSSQPPPVSIQTRRILLFSTLLPLLTPLESCLWRFLSFSFFFTLAHHQLRWPLVKKKQRSGWRRCRWKRERALGVLAVL